MQRQIIQCSGSSSSVQSSRPIKPKSQFAPLFLWTVWSEASGSGSADLRALYCIYKAFLIIKSDVQVWKFSIILLISWFILFSISSSEFAIDQLQMIDIEWFFPQKLSPTESLVSLYRASVVQKPKQHFIHGYGLLRSFV